MRAHAHGCAALGAGAGSVKRPGLFSAGQPRSTKRFSLPRAPSTREGTELSQPRATAVWRAVRLSPASPRTAMISRYSAPRTSTGTPFSLRATVLRGPATTGSPSPPPAGASVSGSTSRDAPCSANASRYCSRPITRRLVPLQLPREQPEAARARYAAPRPAPEPPSHGSPALPAPTASAASTSPGQPRRPQPASNSEQPRLTCGNPHIRFGKETASHGATGPPGLAGRPVRRRER